MGGPSSDCIRLSDELGRLSAVVADDAQWQQVEISAQALANALRVKNGPGAFLALIAYIVASNAPSYRSAVDNHTILGKSALPATLNRLLKIVLDTPLSALEDVQTGATFEILRVGANLCMDHGKCVFALVGR